MDDEIYQNIIERLQRQLCDTHFALGTLTANLRRIKEKYSKYWTTLSPDAVPRPDMLREFEREMQACIEGTLNDKMY